MLCSQAVSANAAHLHTSDLHDLYVTSCDGERESCCALCACSQSASAPMDQDTLCKYSVGRVSHADTGYDCPTHGPLATIDGLRQTWSTIILGQRQIIIPQRKDDRPFLGRHHWNYHWYDWHYSLADITGTTVSLTGRNGGRSDHSRLGVWSCQCCPHTDPVHGHHTHGS